MLVSPGRAYRGCITNFAKRCQLLTNCCEKSNIVFDLLKRPNGNNFGFNRSFGPYASRSHLYTTQLCNNYPFFARNLEKKIKITNDTYLCLSVSSLWTNLASFRMCDWNRNSLPLFGGRTKVYHP